VALKTHVETSSGLSDIKGLCLRTVSRMWKSSDGVAHTVALADPRSGMSGAFVDCITALDQADRDLLVDAIEDFEEELELLLDSVAPRDPTTPEQDALPDGYLQGEFHSGAAMRDYLNSIDPEWKLDAYLAVGDLLDELDED
jgi:hypothetical protein